MSETVIAVLSLFYSSLAYHTCKGSCDLAAWLSPTPEYIALSLEVNSELFWGMKAQDRIPYSKPYGFQLTVPLFWLGSHILTEVSNFDFMQCLFQSSKCF